MSFDILKRSKEELQVVSVLRGWGLIRGRTTFQKGLTLCGIGPLCEKLVGKFWAHGNCEAAWWARQ